MKRRALRIPAVLVCALGGTAAIATTTTISCGGESQTVDAGCSVFCFAGTTDGGVPPDGGCPLCADFSSGTPTCPSGCQPLG